MTLPDYRIVAAIAVTVALGAILAPGIPAYLPVPFLALFIVTVWRVHDRPEGLMGIAATGILLVIAGASAHIAEGLVLAWLAAAVAAPATGLVTLSRQDLAALAGFCACTLLAAVAIQLSNHVLLPLIAICGTAAFLAAILMIRDYRFRKHLGGVQA